MVSAFECSHHVPTYVTEVRRWFKEAYVEAHLQMNCEAKKQKQYYDKTMSTTQLVLGDMVLMKNDAYQGKQKVKDRWSEIEYVVVHQVADGVPAYEVKDEEVPWYELVIPLTSGAEGMALSLAKYHVAAWQWNIKVHGEDGCPPAPSVLNIGQFIMDEEAAGACESHTGSWPSPAHCSRWARWPAGENGSG